MSDPEIKKGLRELSETGQISRGAAREGINHPIEGEKLLLLGGLKSETERQSLALFGDRHLSPPGINPGLVADMREIKIIIYRGIWTIAGGAALGGFLIMLVGIWVEWMRR